MQNLYTRLSKYEKREAQSIVRLLLMDTFGFTLTDICAGAINTLTDTQKDVLDSLMTRLETGEPIQYVIGKTSFCNRTFHVRQGCLIPRPETEELCQWVMQENISDADILDIGTGSGCIAITLKKELPFARVTAWDISHDALTIAKENAETNGAKITMVLQDVLHSPDDNEKWDIIVSNPPYVCEKEAKDMEHNVLGFEPQLALFVPDEHPLIFYRSITQYATHALKPNGKLFFEINPTYSDAIVTLLINHGFTDIKVKNDDNGKKRMVKGVISHSL